MNYFYKIGKIINTPDGWYGRTAHNNGGLVGLGGNSSKTNPIYVIGSNYKPATTSLSNMYGIGYTHTNAGFIPGSSSWGMYVAADGDARIFLAASANGKSYFNAGNVGIGLTNPSEKLEVNGNIKATKFIGDGSELTGISGSGLWNENYNGIDFNGGDVVIGEKLGRQWAKLNVNAESNVEDVTTNSYNGIMISSNKVIGVNNGNDVYSEQALTMGVDTDYGTGVSYLQSFYAWSSPRPLILNPSGGGVGIGTADIPSGYKLAVKGDIIAEKVVVKVYGDWWPDFVFSKNYDLMTLNSVEEYINKNFHLPGVPSANEVSENGIDLGEMNKILLQKLEEMTLYMIEQNKRIEALEKNNQNNDQ